MDIIKKSKTRFFKQSFVNPLFIIVCIAIAFSVGCQSRVNNKTDIKLKYMWKAYAKYDPIRYEQGKGFNQKFPEVTILPEPVSGAGFHFKILSMAASATLPDVFAIYGAVTLETYARKGVLLDLTEYTKNDPEYKMNEIYPHLLRDFMYKGRLYALPANCGVDIMYYNKNIFDEKDIEYPDENWTWDTLVEKGRILTEKENSNIKRFGVVMDSAWNVFVSQNGGRMWNEDKTRCIINSPQTKEALQFLYDCIPNYQISPSWCQSIEF